MRDHGVRRPHHVVGVQLAAVRHSSWATGCATRSFSQKWTPRRILNRAVVGPVCSRLSATGTGRGDHRGIRGARRAPRTPRAIRWRARGVRVDRQAASVVQRTFEPGAMAPSITSRAHHHQTDRLPPNQLATSTGVSAGCLARSGCPTNAIRLSPHRSPATSQGIAHSAAPRARCWARFTAANTSRWYGRIRRAGRDFLAFEAGPSETIHLQWATYYGAADEAAISRLYGCIHPSVDDLPGRVLGSRISQRQRPDTLEPRPALQPDRPADRTPASSPDSWPAAGSTRRVSCVTRRRGPGSGAAPVTARRTAGRQASAPLARNRTRLCVDLRPARHWSATCGSAILGQRMDSPTFNAGHSAPDPQAGGPAAQPHRTPAE